MFIVRPIHAQNARLAPNTPVDGDITIPNQEQTWTFFGGQSMVVSLRVIPEGNFDPVVILRDANGNELIRNDDYDYPNRRDALLEAITLPRLGDYQVAVTGYEGSIGTFTLTMLVGYADFSLDERFTSFGDWQADNLTSADAVDGILTMQVDGIAEVGRLLNRQIPRQKDFYAQAVIANVTGRNGWIVGMTFREQANGNRYVVSVSSRGDWRLSVWENNTARVLRDWTTHPAIVAGDTTFTLGILAKDVSIDVFYDNQMLASITDTIIQNAGGLGLEIETFNALDSQVTAQIDGLQMTIPTQVDGAFIIPQQLMAGNAILVSHELERRHLIPAGGALAWEVSESFLEASRPGVDRLPLIADTRFTNFVLSTTVSATFVGEGVGACALLFQHADETNYAVAYLDNIGGYGVSVRRGDTFSDDIFGMNESWTVNNASQLLIVVNEGVLYYYVNNWLVGQMDIEPVEGQVGNAVVNFDPIRTNCQFRNTWAWRWE
ncbi:MAG: hypothetical protein KJ043_08915 [Anaerolineae bacterium]|nr:hypothetical protein [Anaerolineae bacterium]